MSQAFEALIVTGFKELSCGCVIKTSSGRITHLRICRLAQDIYQQSGVSNQKPPLSVWKIESPEIYHHFAKGVLL